MNYSKIAGALGSFAILLLVSCNKNEDKIDKKASTITIKNVLNSKPLVESGTFMGTGEAPLIFPNESVSIRFSAAKGEAITFATMYGWSNDLFFAPDNPGILVYDANGNPIEGDVSSQVKLWDNGTRVNARPGADLVHPGVAETQTVKEVMGIDGQGFMFLPASQLINATLVYEGNSNFTLTLKNISGGTANETPLSPGVWAISYIAGGNLLNPAILFSNGQPTANGLTSLAEAGNNQPLGSYVSSITGIFTPLSPILVVIYNGNENPFFMTGENDRGEGLKELAQKGNANILADFLRSKGGVKAVYVLPAPNTNVLLPVIGNQMGGQVSQEISVTKGDRLAIATMYGFSNDWFFASTGNGVDPTITGDISGSIALYDNGTAINQFPGAGITQFNLAGTPLAENIPIAAVPNPNAFTTLPGIPDIIQVTIK